MKQNFIFFVFVFATLFILISPDPLSDPDFGWHIRTGERIITTHSIPRTDWFSYTLPNYNWVDHEWSQDVIVYTFWKFGGLLGVQLWYAVLASILIFLLLPRLATTILPKEISGVLAFLTAGLLTSTVFWRPQIITIIFFTLTLVLFKKIKKANDPRLALWFMPLFFFWANLHGGFAIGVCLVAWILFVEYFKYDFLEHNKENQFVRRDETLTKKTWFASLKWFLISIPLTFLNPYGWRIYEEAIRTIHAPIAKQIITEWLPTQISSPLGALIIIFTIFLIALFTLREDRPDLTNLTLIILFLIIGLSSYRHAIFFIIVCIPELTRIRITLPQAKVKTFGTILLATCVIILAQTKPNFFGSSLQNTNTSLSYPANALTFLNGRQEHARIFNSYGWGGYIILENPNTKTFIDGRMAHWQTDNNKSLLKIYDNTSKMRPGWQKTLEEYDVNLVLVQPSEPIAEGLRLLPTLWEKAYEDKIALVFIKK